MVSETWESTDSNNPGSGTWEFDESTGVLTVSGTGYMPYYNNESLVPWHDYRTLVTKIIVRGVQRIVQFSFSNCTNVTELEIVDVLEIGYESFKNLTSLKKLTIPDSVELISNISTGASSGAFSGCTGLESITIGSNVNTIYPGAFGGCYNVKNVYFKSTEAPTFAGTTGMLPDKSQFSLGTSTNPANVTIYTTGWGNSTVFNTGMFNAVLGQYTTATFETWDPSAPIGSTVHVKVNGEWKDSTPYVNVGGTWKEVTAVYVNVGGTWKEVV